MYQRHSCLKPIIAAIFLILIATTATAFTFMPMSTTISPSGANSIASFRITNDSSQQIAITIKATTREIDENGNEINAPADNQFAIFPTRIVVQPNSFQNIKVQYKGNPSQQKKSLIALLQSRSPSTLANNRLLASR